jgi:outer membrane lipoprotein SlyB
MAMSRKNSNDSGRHSKVKGAAIGAVAGKLIGGGKKSAAAGAVIGERRQAKKNREGR